MDLHDLLSLSHKLLANFDTSLRPASPLSVMWRRCCVFEIILLSKSSEFGSVERIVVGDYLHRQSKTSEFALEAVNNKTTSLALLDGSLSAQNTPTDSML